MYFGIYTLIPICLGHYIGSKILSMKKDKDSRVPDYVASFATPLLIYPFTMMQTKLMCEIASKPSERRYLGFNDICQRLPKICGIQSLFRGGLMF